MTDTPNAQMREGESMARQGGMVLPSSQTFGLGEDIGCFVVMRDEIYLEVGIDHDGHPVQYPINPNLAPMFRMIANRLDEITGKRARRN